MLSAQSTDARASVTVNAPPEKAFEVFTSGIGSWWPRSHHLGDAELTTVVIEPRAGGRWYERTADGAECDWGEVLEWQPPQRLVLSWRIGTTWQLEDDPSRASVVEIGFAPDGAGSTTVTLVHTRLDRHGDDWPAMRDSVAGSGGWPAVLQAYADAC
jgi:uncharacterized protein YndB with AHSA1/START domain